MKKLIVLIFIMLLMQTNLLFSQSSDFITKNEVEKFIRKYSELFNSKQYERLESFFDDKLEVRFVTDYGDLSFSKEEYLNRLNEHAKREDEFAHKEHRAEVEIIEIEIKDNVAITKEITKEKISYIKLGEEAFGLHNKRHARARAPRKE